MSNRYHEKIMLITELASHPKRISDEGVKHLREVVENYMDKTGNNNLVDVLPFITNYIYNEAYRIACSEVLEILRRK